jgi:hypothetical protein
VAQCVFRAGWLASDNLWDYLMDPWLVCWAVGWLLRDRLLSARALLAQQSSTQPSAAGWGETGATEAAGQSKATT